MQSHSLTCPSLDSRHFMTPFAVRFSARDLARVARSLRNTLCALVLINGAGCGKAGTAVVLPDPCDAPALAVTALRLANAGPAGRVREFIDLSGADTGERVGVIADSGLFIGVIASDAIVLGPRVVSWGRGADRLGGVAAVTVRSTDTVVAVDRGMPRIVRLSIGGSARRDVPLRDPAGIDGYAAGGGEVVAITSRRADRAFEETSGELFLLDSTGNRGRRVAQFRSPALHVIGQPSGAKLLTRPFEHQPIVRWSTRWGWMILSTDSLNLQFADGAARGVIVGTGRRAPIDDTVREAGLSAYVRRTGATGAIAATIRKAAEQNLFAGRSSLQLVDEMVPLRDGRVALRRMRLCRDRQGWNVLDTLGVPTAQFTLPLSFVPTMAVRAGLLATTGGTDSLTPVIASFPR